VASTTLESYFDPLAAGGWLRLWWCGLCGEFDGDGFQFGDELAQAVVGELGRDNQT
jgi:hypothetical protein